MDLLQAGIQANQKWFMEYQISLKRLIIQEFPLALSLKWLALALRFYQRFF